VSSNKGYGVFTLQAPPLIQRWLSHEFSLFVAGVLTKVDLMDAGTDARELLSGRLFHLKRGFIPVVGRSQKDILEGMPLDKALLREKLFFERHPAYRDIAATRCGISHLSRTLSTLVMSAIRAWLPKVRSQVSLMLQTAEQELRELGPPAAATPEVAGQTVLKLLTAYAANFSNMIEGRSALVSTAGGIPQQDLLIRQLFGGARLQEHIRSRFSTAIEDWLSGFVRHSSATLPSAEILMALRNSAGLRPVLDIPEDAFIALTRRALLALKNQGGSFERFHVACTCYVLFLLLTVGHLFSIYSHIAGRSFVAHVFDELREVAEFCLPAEMERFRDLRDRSVEVAHDLSRLHYSMTVEQIDRLLEYELAHINVLHPDFCGAENARRAIMAGEDKALFCSGGTGVAGELAFDDHEIYQDDEAPSAASDSSSLANQSADPVVNGSGGGERRSKRRAGGDGQGSNHEERLFERVDHQQQHQVPPQPADVHWALNKLGGIMGGPSHSPSTIALDATRYPRGSDRRSGGSSSGRAGNGGGSGGDVEHPADLFRNAAPAAAPHPSTRHSADGGASASTYDVAARFRPHIVSHIAGHGPEDPLPPGAIRVGGPHTPFIARPVETPGSVSYGRSGVGGGHGEPSYRHFDLLQLPSRPLPGHITPADLKPTTEEKRQIRVTRYLVYSYLQIVKKNYQDMVPKLVIALLVRKCQEELSSALIHSLYSSLVSHPDGLLAEDDNIANKRQRLTQSAQLLKSALEVISEVRGVGGAALD
jgi:Dynamin central region/Dynamin GTPase effector domain